MAITTLLDPTALPARTMDQSAFDAAMAYLMTNLPPWGAQANALAANLNSIAFGGAYALPYVWQNNTISNGGSSGGVISFSKSDGSVSGGSDATRVLLDSVVGGQSVAPLLTEIATSTSATRGYLKVTKVGDTSKWIVFSFTTYTTQSSYYGLLNVTPVAYSSATPFANNDAVVAQFQRTGDRGDTGATGSGAMVLLSQQTVGSAVANIDFTSVFSSAYDKYIIDLQGVKASASDTLSMRVIKSGTADSSSGAYLAPVADGGTGTTATTMAWPVASGTAGSFVVEVMNANDASTNVKTVAIRGSWQATGSASVSRNGGYILAGPLNGFRLYWGSAANFTQGTVRVFGIKNS